MSNLILFAIIALAGIYVTAGAGRMKRSVRAVGVALAILGAYGLLIALL